MKRADRYVFGELAVPFLAALTLAALMLVCNTLFAYLGTMLREGWPLAMVLRMLALNLPTALVYALPVSTALAVSLATHRLSHDNEIQVMRGAGVPLLRICLPFVAFGALTTAGAVFLSEKVVPAAWKEQLDVEALLDGLPSDPVAGGLTLRIENFTITFSGAQKVAGDKRRLNKVVAYEAPRTAGGFATLYTVTSADYDAGFWRLRGAHVYTVALDGSLEGDGRVADVVLRLPVDFEQAARPMGRWVVGKEGFADTTRRMREARRLGQEAAAHEMDVRRWFDLSLPSMCLAFGVCTPPLALRFARSGSFAGVLLSVVMVFIAWNAWFVMRAAAQGGLLPPATAAWAPTVLFSAVGLWLLRAQE